MSGGTKPRGSDEILLELDGLQVEFRTEDGVVRAVRGLSYSLRRGETLGVVGESGSGKSVSHMALLGLLPPNARIDAEQLQVQDQDLLASSESMFRKIRGRKIAMVFQDPMTALNPFLTLGTQIGEMLHLHRGLRGRKKREAAVQALAEVGIPDPELRVEQYPHEFSGGMRQRAMIAMMLAGDPEILIADEPTTALDVTVQAQILELLHGLQERRGMSIVLITHDLGVVAAYAHRVLVMYAGRIVEMAGCRELFARPSHPYTRGLLGSIPRLDQEGATLQPIGGQPPDLANLPSGCPFRERCSFVEPRCAEEDPQLREIGDGTPHQISCHLELPSFALTSSDAARRLRGVDTAPLLELRDLKVQFPGRSPGRPIRAVDGVDFTIHQGETLGLVGESGCGKSTTARALVGLAPVQQGEARIGGEDVFGRRGKRLLALRRRVQMVFQDPFASLDPRMTVRSILSEPLEIHRLARGKDKLLRCTELMLQVGLDPRFLNRYPHEFSGGQRQRIGIARALALDPELLLLDEPVSALDVSIQAQVLELLEELRERRGLSYLFIAHDLSVVRHLCDRVAVMYLGRIVETAPAKQLFATPRHPYTQALLSAVPVPDPVVEAERKRVLLPGDPPSPDRDPAGCAFAARCPLATEQCRQETPQLEGEGQLVACWEQDRADQAWQRERL
ncbi:MAG: glutathione ABC transporter ATP-binding protein [Planctomycetota bacterium]|nr:MAG: glutathione ABC transporter ATP-binding protein [Planctomycetota bacterium]